MGQVCTLLLYMVIMGLDIATTTGYSVVRGDKLVEYGTFSLDSKDSHPQRFRAFRTHLKSLYKQNRPELLILESVYTGPNPKVTAYLNNLRGIAIESAPKKCLIVSTEATKARKIILGKGNADKLAVFNWAIDKFGLTELTYKTHNDISDSMLLCCWGQDYLIKNPKV